MTDVGAPDSVRASGGRKCGRAAVAGKIFINYRRGDDAGFTQALYQRLEDEFGADNIFMDVEGHIKPGDDFVHVLDAQVAAADILLAIIGPRWMDLMAKRAGDPDDFVAIEIGSALEKEKRVIPVLVGGALMPRADALPENIRNMTRRNAVGLRPERFKADTQGLVTALKEQLAAAEREKAKNTAERAAAESARRKAEDEAANRAREAEQRARAQANAGLTPEQIIKAEELANWDFIKESSDPQEFRDHLARFPGGVVERNARAKLEALLWDAIINADRDDLFVGERLASFQTEFPDGKFAADAKALRAKFAERAKQAGAMLARMQAERDAWADASRINTTESYRAFLKIWPDGRNATAAKGRLADLGHGSEPGRRYRQIAAALMLLAGLAATGWWIVVDLPWQNSTDIAGEASPISEVRNRTECYLLCLNVASCTGIVYDASTYAYDGLRFSNVMPRCYQHSGKIEFVRGSANRSARSLR